MTPLTYHRASTVADALRLTEGSGRRLLGGGTNLVDLMRKGVEGPTDLVDVTGLSVAIHETHDGGLLIGAAARNSSVAAHPLVRARYPMLSRAILAGASAQIRNMATVGGNLMQRTRCLYFQDAAASRCNKRSPGSGCDAIGGFNRYNAVIGTSSACIAAHPSDMCVALAALGAQVHVASSAMTRTIPLFEFHRLPGERPDLETMLEPGEMIVSVELPAEGFSERSAYRKVRDRASYGFALVSVAAGLKMQGDTVKDVRIALGGIAPRPWRAFRTEAALLGRPASREAFAAAAADELADAQPQPRNAFKVDLARRTLSAVLAELIERRI